MRNAWQYAMHGVATADANGIEINYGQQLKQFGHRNIGRMLTDYLPGDLEYEGPQRYWSYDASSLYDYSGEVRDDENWWAVRGMITRERNTYIGELVVPAFYVERTIRRRDMGELGQVMKGELVLARVERATNAINGMITSVSRIVWGNDLADFRKTQHTNRYIQAVEQVQAAEELILGDPRFRKL